MDEANFHVVRGPVRDPCGKKLKAPFMNGPQITASKTGDVGQTAEFF